MVLEDTLLLRRPVDRCESCRVHRRTSAPSAHPSPIAAEPVHRQADHHPGLRNPTLRKSAASVLLYPAQDKKVLVIGGVGGATGPAIRDVDLIDYSVYPNACPASCPKRRCRKASTLVLTTLLPNGQLFATGGNTTGAEPAALGGHLLPGRRHWDPRRHTTRRPHPPPATTPDWTVAVSTFGGNPSAKVFEDDEEKTGTPRGT